MPHPASPRCGCSPDSRWTALCGAPGRPTPRAAFGYVPPARAGPLAPRARRVIHAATRNAARYHLRPGPLRMAAHLGLGMASRFVPGRMLGAFDWLYGYDVTKAAR